MDELMMRVLPLARSINSQEQSMAQLETTSFLEARLQNGEFL